MMIYSVFVGQNCHEGGRAIRETMFAKTLKEEILRQK
jgi:hypothetical protein